MWRWNSKTFSTAGVAFDPTEIALWLENSASRRKPYILGNFVTLLTVHIFSVSDCFISDNTWRFACRFLTLIFKIMYCHWLEPSQKNYHNFLSFQFSSIGSYVCVVAKELAEPSPNFIVVYDLQSGTLFKKWKPSCNTVSLSISQANTCVIAGLEDARIMVWDLVTGNCRCTLTGRNWSVSWKKWILYANAYFRS